MKDGSAIVNQDYIVNGNQVTLPKGVSSVPLPITIKDDNIPEPSETFTVTLVQVYGGGVLGTIKETNVIILVSDDPNGAFGKPGCIIVLMLIPILVGKACAKLCVLD